MSSERSTVTVVLCVASVFNLLTAECLVPYASDNSWSVYYVKPSDVEYCPLHFQPCHILDYYVNIPRNEIREFSGSCTRFAESVQKSRNCALLLYYYVESRRSEVLRSCAQKCEISRARECLSPGTAIKHYSVL